MKLAQLLEARYTEHRVLKWIREQIDLRRATEDFDDRTDDWQGLPITKQEYKELHPIINQWLDTNEKPYKEDNVLYTDWRVEVDGATYTIHLQAFLYTRNAPRQLTTIPKYMVFVYTDD